jgi:anti-anti-sigma factor
MSACAVQVDAHRSDGHVELAVRGEVDISAIEPFRRAIDDALRHRCGIVIDLRDTAFLGVCALEPIIRAVTELREHEAGVTVVIGSELHRRLLTLTGADAFVAIEECEEADRRDASSVHGDCGFQGK